MIENSKPYASKSNGRAENTVGKVERQVWQAMGRQFDVHHPGFSWLVEHTADILTKCAVGRDGRTPYERIKGKKYHGEMFEFGSVVHVKLQGKLQGGLMQERWVTGVWLGKRWSSDEHIISLPNGKVVRARDARPEPDERAFDLNMFDAIRGTPSDPSAVGGGDGAYHELPRAPLPRPVEPVAPAVARRVLIQKKFLEKFGYSEGCAKCRAMRRNEEGKASLGHSARCRERIEQAMSEDEELSKVLAAANERQDQYLSAEVERGDRHGSEATADVNPRQEDPPPRRPEEPAPLPSRSPAVEEEDEIPVIGED